MLSERSPFNPLEATATLMRKGPSGGFSLFAGTCFAFRHPDYYLSAAHCVANCEPSELSVAQIAAGPEPHMAQLRLVTVLDVARHEDADIAVLRVDPAVAPSIAPPYPGRVVVPAVGEDFMAFGFPEAIIGPRPAQPTPRVFKGHFQRRFHHESHLGFEYAAGELSVGCPAGLSGGPLFQPAAQETVVAVATENVESTTGADFEEITEGETRTVYRRVLTYGVAVLLDPLLPWLEAQMPSAAD